MGEKSKKNGGIEKKNNGEIVQKKDPVGGNKKDGNLTADVSVTKDVKAIRRVGDCVEEYSEKLTVSGKFDSAILREIVGQKTHIRVELISPVPKKDGKGKADAGAGEGKKNQISPVPKKDDKGKGDAVAGEGKKNQISPVPKKDGKGKGDAGAGEGKKNQNKEKENKEGKKTKEKEPPITMAVLTVPLHCQGCTQKIHKLITEFNAYKEKKIDEEKDLATVIGSMDNMNVLAAQFKKHLKKEAKIVPLKKEDGDKKEKVKGKGGEGNGEGKGKVKA